MNIIIYSLLGFLTSLLFPPYFFLPLGFIIFPILCFSFDTLKNKLNRKKTFINSFCFGFCFFISFLFWIKNPFFIFDETRNFFLISILLIILLSLIFALVFLVISIYKKYLPLVILIPLTFIVSEFIISIFLYGFPWVSFSIILSANDNLMFLPKYLGTMLTSYILIQLFCLPYHIFNMNILKFNFNYYFALLVIISLSIIISSNISKENKSNDLQIINFEIFQLNISSKDQINSSKIYETILSKITNSDADILIFGENNYPFLVKNNELKEIQNNLKENQTVIIGGSRIENGNYYNSLFNINSLQISYFDKKILVPFGEFLPLRNYFKILDKLSGPFDYSLGEKERTLKINESISYLPVICYEIIFYWQLLNNKNFQDNFIINITNDTWFGKYLGPYQHFYITKFRAAEFNKPIIRVSNNGVSGIINENGKILISTQLNTSTSFNYKMKLDNNKNYYSFQIYIKIIFIIFIFISILVKNFRTKFAQDV